MVAASGPTQYCTVLVPKLLVSTRIEAHAATWKRLWFLFVLLVVTRVLKMCVGGTYFMQKPVTQIALISYLLLFPRRSGRSMADRQFGHHAGFRRYEHGGGRARWQSRPTDAAVPVIGPWCRDRTLCFPGAVCYRAYSQRVLRPCFQGLPTELACFSKLTFNA